MTISFDQMMNKLRANGESPKRVIPSLQSLLGAGEDVTICIDNTYPQSPGWWTLQSQETVTAQYKDKEGNFRPLQRVHVNCLVADPTEVMDVTVSAKVHRERANGGNRAYHLRVQKKWDRRYGVKVEQRPVMKPRLLSMGPAMWAKLCDMAKHVHELKSTGRMQGAPLMRPRLDQHADHPRDLVRFEIVRGA